MGHGREQGGVQSHNDKASTERRTGWSAASIYECASRGEHAAETTEVRLIGSGGGERTSYPRVACSGNSIHGDHNNDIITFGYTWNTNNNSFFDPRLGLERFIPRSLSDLLGRRISAPWRGSPGHRAVAAVIKVWLVCCCFFWGPWFLTCLCIDLLHLFLFFFFFFSSDFSLFMSFFSFTCLLIFFFLFLSFLFLLPVFTCFLSPVYWFSFSFFICYTFFFSTSFRLYKVLCFEISHYLDLYRFSFIFFFFCLFLLSAPWVSLSLQNVPRV